MIKNSELNSLTPGQYLKVTLDLFDITEETLIKEALITKENLHYIIHGNRLIPASVGIYLEREIGLSLYFWQMVNDKFCKSKNIKYVGTELGYEMLLNKMAFEK